MDDSTDVRSGAADPPTVVTVGVCYLAVPWPACATLLIDWSSLNWLVPTATLVCVTALWWVVLWRMLRGGPIATGLAPVVALVVSALVLFRYVVTPALVLGFFELTTLVLGRSADLGGPVLPGPAWWVVVLTNAGALAAGVALRQPRVQDWVTATHRARTPAHRVDR